MTTTTPDNELIYEVAAAIRDQFVEVLEASLCTKETQGSCLYACTLLASALERFTKFQVLCRGGQGETSGFKDSNGKLHGHYWLVVNTGACSYIVDITADQFGYPKIIVENEAVATAYLPGDQDVVDEHFKEVNQSIQASKSQNI